MVVTVVCLFHVVPSVGMQCVIVAFPGHTHLFLPIEGKYFVGLCFE